MTRADYELIGMLSILVDFVLTHKECMKRYPDEPIEAVSSDELLSQLRKMKEGVIIGIETDT